MLPFHLQPSQLGTIHFHVMRLPLMNHLTSMQLHVLLPLKYLYNHFYQKSCLIQRDLLLLYYHFLD